MTDPVKALADAARSTCFQGLTCDAPFRLIPSESLRGNLINLRNALAAYYAAQAQHRPLIPGHLIDRTA